MSKADRPEKLYFKGEYDAEGQALEYFGPWPGKYDGIPARDLDAEWLAGATEAQWEVLESENGRRLYQKTEPAARQSSDADKPSSSTPSRPAGTSAPTADD